MGGWGRWRRCLHTNYKTQSLHTAHITRFPRQLTVFCIIHHVIIIIIIIISTMFMTKYTLRTTHYTSYYHNNYYYIVVTPRPLYIRYRSTEGGGPPPFTPWHERSLYIVCSQLPYYSHTRNTEISCCSSDLRVPPSHGIGTHPA